MTRLGRLTEPWEYGFSIAEPEAHDVNFDLPGLDALSGGPRTELGTNIKALMQAVLEEAVRNYLGRNLHLRAEVERWLAARGRNSPFAFPVICETLGLEPSAVRVALGRLREARGPNGQTFRRTRANARRAAHILAR